MYRYMYNLFGVFLAKALIDGQTLGIRVHPLILLALITPPDVVLNVIDTNNTTKRKSSYYQLSLLANSEPEFHRGLQWISENSVEGQLVLYVHKLYMHVFIDAELTFSTSYEAYTYNSSTRSYVSKQVTVELVPGGKDIIVTEETKGKYIQAMVEWICRRR